MFFDSNNLIKKVSKLILYATPYASIPEKPSLQKNWSFNLGKEFIFCLYDSFQITLTKNKKQDPYGSKNNHFSNLTSKVIFIHYMDLCKNLGTK